MSKKIILIGFLLALTTFLTIKFVHSQTSITPIKPKEFNEKVLWSLIQDWKGNKSYIEDQKLCEIASVRSKQIQKDFSHNKFQLVLDQYLGNSLDKITVSENIANAYKQSEKQMFSGWLNSPTHRKTLDISYDFSCLKCSKNNLGINYCAQIFSNLDE